MLLDLRQFVGLILLVLLCVGDHTNVGPHENFNNKKNFVLESIKVFFHLREQFFWSIRKSKKLFLLASFFYHILVWNFWIIMKILITTKITPWNKSRCFSFSTSEHYCLCQFKNFNKSLCWSGSWVGVCSFIFQNL